MIIKAITFGAIMIVNMIFVKLLDTNGEFDNEVQILSGVTLVVLIVYVLLASDKQKEEKTETKK